jgi:hypothetical protein
VGEIAQKSTTTENQNTIPDMVWQWQRAVTIVTRASTLCHEFDVQI